MAHVVERSVAVVQRKNTAVRKSIIIIVLLLLGCSVVKSILLMTLNEEKSSITWGVQHTAFFCRTTVKSFFGQKRLER